MTNSELIELLKKYPMDARVYLDFANRQFDVDLCEYDDVIDYDGSEKCVFIKHDCRADIINYMPADKGCQK